MDSPVVAPVVQWYRAAARDLPWRRPTAGPWAVLVSEVMLQQTPVNRVLPAYAAWLERWPTPADLAADSPGEAVRMWGKLGYPRRALRLHECARAITERNGGEVPRELTELLALPGVGAYTARAVAVFAYGDRHAVVDTNVRRVVARAVGGQGDAGPPATSRDLAAVDALLPDDKELAATLSIGLMELGALVCTARSPRCADCPLVSQCAWRAAGCPPYDGSAVRPQRFAGTDRQVRGLIMDVLRGAAGPVWRVDCEGVWHDAEQRERALAALISDGLVEALDDGRLALPGGSTSATN